MAGWLSQREYIARAEFHAAEAPGATCLEDLERSAVGPAYRPAVREPAEPTDALPGTEEKILVMRRRHETGERLHHPDDPVIDWSPDEDDGDDRLTTMTRAGARRKSRFFKRGYW